MSRESTVLWVDPTLETNADRLDRVRSIPREVVVLTARTCEEALAASREQTIDCLITEYQLPDGDGIELFERVREHCAVAPAILCTDSGSERIASDALAAGFNGYVPKADGLELLCERLEDVLELGSVDAREPRSQVLAADEDVRIVDQAPVAIIEWNRDLTVAEWNPKATELFGYEREEALGEHAATLLVPDESKWMIEQGWERLMRDPAGSRRVNDNVRKDDSRLTCEWYNTPIEVDGESVGALSFVQDVTQRAQRRQFLKVLNRVLRHDLRNGMNIIRGCVETIADAAAMQSTRQAEMVYRRTDELVSLANKTRRIERFVRDDSERATVDLAALVPEVVDRITERFPEATATVTVPDSALAEVHEHFDCGLEEVVENAIVHTDQPEPTVDVTVANQEETISIVVADQGPGVPEPERSLFEGTREITQLEHASGVGLWVVYWAVRTSDGTLNFEDNDPRGTVVRITLQAIEE
jgi:PAS domain S-box-containing protein